MLASVASALAVVIAAFTYTFVSTSAPALSVAARGSLPEVRPPTRSEAAPTIAPRAPPALEVAPPDEAPTATPAAAFAEAATPPALPRVAAPAATASAPPPAAFAAPPPAIEVASLLGPPPVAPAATATPSPAVAEPRLALNDRERGLVDAMNVHRRAAGLVPLEVADGLTTAARSRSSDMLTNNYFAHSSPSGQTWYSILGSMGLTYAAGGENLAKVSGNAPAAVTLAIDALMASPTHRANILNPAYRRVGVGASSQGDALTIFTTIFTDR